jgi:hypothetical protein
MDAQKVIEKQYITTELSVREILSFIKITQSVIKDHYQA